MGIKLSQFAQKAQAKWEEYAASSKGNPEVEFIVCTKDGQILLMYVEGRASDMTKALKLFGK